MKDVNGSGFQLLLGPDDWSAAIAADAAHNIAWEPSAGSVALEVEVQRFPPRSGAPRLRPADRRGADSDCFGNWYWIDSTRRVIRGWRQGQEASDLWSADQLDAKDCQPTGGHFVDSAEQTSRYEDLRLSGLAVTTRHYLLVGTRAPQGLLVFDLHAEGPPVFTLWPTVLNISVFDMGRAAGGGAWILDRGGPFEPGRLWRLDDRLCLVRLDGLADLPAPKAPHFVPEGGSAIPIPAPAIPAGLDLLLPSPAGIPGVSAPISVLGLPDDTVLVLDAPAGAPSRLLRYGTGGLIGAATLDANLLDAFKDPPTDLRAHDMAFLPSPNPAPGRILGTLIVVDDQGDQALKLTFAADAAAPGVTPDPALEVALVADFLPFRRFEGRALVAQGGLAYYDIGERWVAIAADPRRRRKESGQLGPVRFDSGQPGTPWHRIIMDGCIPAGTAVTVEVRAADALDELERIPFSPLPAPYRRREGPETPLWEPFANTDTTDATGSWETLIQSARGRLIELRLQFTGDRHATPRIRALRLHNPRFSYLERYLPAVYREDSVSAHFLDRFLANVEGLFTTMENRVAAAYGLFDTRIAPAEGLEWLAGWLGAVLGPDWDDTRRRLFIDHAELLFRWRGTPAGLKAMIDIVTDPCPDASLFDGLRSGDPQEPDTARRGVRLSEHYARRIVVEADAEPIPMLTTWTPADGAAPIHLAFGQFALAQRGTDLAGLSAAWGRSTPFGSIDQVHFSPLVPQNEAEAEDWLAFTSGPLGFPYAPATAADAPAWRGFLARRYASPARLAGVHGAVGYDPQTLPVDLPAGGTRLSDWIDFVSGVLPVAQAAHQFVVLAPVQPGEDPASRDVHIERIADVVRRERPAHTAYEVRPFWALFQAGNARLGIDTTLGAGARYIAIELGRTALSEGFVGYGHTLSVRDRALVGRDATGGIQL